MDAAGGYSARALATWLSPRNAMRGVLAMRPREGSILAFGMIAMLFIFVARMPETLELARTERISAPAMVSAQFVTLLLFGPLFLYGVSALVQFGLRAASGQGGWYETRLATFWALMVTAPAHGLALIVPHPAPGLAAALAGAWIWSGCLAEVQNVAQWRATLVAVGCVAALAGLAWLLAAAA